jgi:hypothetical protein
MVTFATQNVIMDPPFTKLDILICRNLLIYLTPELQKKLLAALSLQPESRAASCFWGARRPSAPSPISSTAGSQVKALPAARIRLGGRTCSVSCLVCPRPAGSSQGVNDVETCSQSPVARGPAAPAALFPAAVLVNDKGDILYISGRTGKYLEPAAGKANLEHFRHGPRRSSVLNLPAPSRRQSGKKGNHVKGCQGRD